MRSIRVYADTCRRIKCAAAGIDVPMVRLVEKLVGPGLARIEKQQDVSRLASASKPALRPAPDD
jgi:hypothetical protein